MPRRRTNEDELWRQVAPTGADDPAQRKARAEQGLRANKAMQRFFRPPQAAAPTQLPEQGPEAGLATGIAAPQQASMAVAQELQRQIRPQKERAPLEAEQQKKPLVSVMLSRRRGLHDLSGTGVAAGQGALAWRARYREKLAEAERGRQAEAATLQHTRSLEMIAARGEQQRETAKAGVELGGPEKLAKAEERKAAHTETVRHHKATEQNSKERLTHYKDKEAQVQEAEKRGEIAKGSTEKIGRAIKKIEQLNKRWLNLSSRVGELQKQDWEGMKQPAIDKVEAAIAAAQKKMGEIQSGKDDVRGIEQWEALIDEQDAELTRIRGGAKPDATGAAPGDEAPSGPFTNDEMRQHLESISQTGGAPGDPTRATTEQRKELEAAAQAYRDKSAGATTQPAAANAEKSAAYQKMEKLIRSGASENEVGDTFDSVGTGLSDEEIIELSELWIKLNPEASK